MSEQQLEFPVEEGFQEHDDTLDQIVFLGKYTEELDERIAQQQQALKELVDKRTHVVTKALPALFEQKGISKFTLSNGTTIALQPVYGASLSKDNIAAMDWLENNGHGEIIKHMLTAELGRERTGEEIFRILEALNQQFEVRAITQRTVHPSTLRAWVKEMCERKLEFPKNLFNVYEGQIVKFS